MVNTDLKPQLAAGYAAPEQYGFDTDCGAAADVYALAATIFRALTGNPPPLASTRARSSDDLFVPADIARDMPDHVAAALFNALQVPVEKRTPTVTALRDQLAAAPAVTQLINEEKLEPKRPVPPPMVVEKEEEPEEEDEDVPPSSNKSRNVKVALLIVAGVFVVLMLVAFAVLFMVFPELFGRSGKESSTPSVQSEFSMCPPLPVNRPPSLPARCSPWRISAGRAYYDVKDKSFNGRHELVDG